MLLSAASVFPQTQAFGDRFALIIGGIGGEQSFSNRYLNQISRMYTILHDELGYDADRITVLGEHARNDSIEIGIANRENIRAAFSRFSKKMQASDQLFIFMVGHGTFDGTWSKFNIVGPDLRDFDYAEMIASLPTQKMILVNTTSSSGPFIDKLSGPERVIVTATKNGLEYLETTFADFFLDALSAGAADLDKNKRISVLEAFNFASATQNNHYEQDRRLRAEHPLLDDNADGKGSEKIENIAEGDGLLASRVYIDPVPEGLRETLRRVESGEASEADKLALEKTKLLQEIESLKARKERMSTQDYNAELERLFVKLARLNSQLKDENSATP